MTWQDILVLIALFGLVLAVFIAAVFIVMLLSDWFEEQ
jgi:hypothetical protein